MKYSVPLSFYFLVSWKDSISWSSLEIWLMHPYLKVAFFRLLDGARIWLTLNSNSEILWMRVWWTLYLDLETRALYTKPAFEVLDLKNFNSFEVSGLDVATPVFFQTRVWRPLRPDYLASFISDAGPKSDRVQIALVKSASEVHNFNCVCLSAFTFLP